MKITPRLYVFDLGETLVNYRGIPLNWRAHYIDALQFACSAAGIETDERKITRASSELLKYNTRVNPRPEEVAAEIVFEEIFRIFEATDEIKKLLIEKFFEYFQRKTEPEETAEELLDLLKEKKAKIAVLTDVPYGMPKYLVEKDLGKLLTNIDLLVTSVDAGHRKPSTKGLELILQNFGVESSETIFVGNEEKDIETANSLKVYSVLLCQEINPPNWRQSRTIKKLIELMPMLT